VFKQSNLKLVEVLQNHHFDEKEFNHLNIGVITQSNFLGCDDQRKVFGRFFRLRASSVTGLIFVSENGGCGMTNMKTTKAASTEGRLA